MNYIQILQKLLKLKKQLLALLLKQRKIPLLELATTMARFEGYYLLNSRADRNNNPLNIKWSPFSKSTDGTFVVFKTAEAGWEACMWDLRQKCLGNTRTGLGPESTIKELIFTWTATDQVIYLNFVADKLGVSSSYQLKNFIL